VSADLEGIRIRLLQVRDREAILEEERASFLARCGLRQEQLLHTNVLREMPSATLLDDVDAVLIGGAGAYSVTQTFPWTAALIALCRACAERELPLFGSCWGHQFIARAFGGRVEHDPSRSELGTHSVRLTEAGKADDLFGTLPPVFDAQMGHHDRVVELPPDGVELALSGLAPFQAIRIAGLPIYGSQFHSELNSTSLRHRLVAYRSYYPEVADDEDYRQVFDGVRDSPAADGLLRAFLERFVVPGAQAASG
jgi:GMP synthase (glutamine-hydrolysing)